MPGIVMGTDMVSIQFQNWNWWAIPELECFFLYRSDKFGTGIEVC